MTKLSLKILIQLAFAFVFTKAFAKASFTALPHEIKAVCKANTLIAEIEKLKNFTYSKTKVVEVETNSIGICEAANKALFTQTPVLVEVQSELQNQNSLVKVNYCNSDMETCSALYRKSVLEAVEVRINQIVLYSQAEVPGSAEEYLIEWDSEHCPPYAPNCDL